MKTRSKPQPGLPLPAQRKSDADLKASIASTLADWAPGSDLWLFAYGSLMWNPGCEYSRKEVARVYGYHRSFCLWSRVNRGTPEEPGLVLALEHGGSCTGFAFCIPRERAKEFLLPLWRREMLYGSYCPRWLNCHASGEVIRALAFVINPNASGYCGHLEERERVECVLRGKGIFGTSAEYLFNTVETLSELGIRDEGLERLAMLVRGRLDRS